MSTRSVYRANTDHHGAAAEARAHRGAWVAAGLYPTRDAARATVRRVPSGVDYPSYTPKEFEAYCAIATDGWAVWVRWVAGEGPVPDLPDTMTVRVTSRGDGPGYTGVGVVTVTVTARCPRCGGPRGWDAVTPYRFCEDGAWYTVDRWLNPCTHRDLYEDVLRESRLRPPPPPRPADVVIPQSPPISEEPEPGSPAGLILTAAAGWRGMHAAKAADLLETVHGLAMEAEAIRTEMRVRRGHMSAKAAAHFLHTATKDPR
ncbi:hypothetical protein [Streptomyces anulatus]|uniref:hypothetical protein n=1 Tax=Streptomyces anulatus TaxID=1892 RepID=UPI0036A7ABF8